MVRARADGRGFTLLEVLLSVVIIGMLAGISLPIYASFQTRNDLDLTTQRVAEMLRRAQVYSRGVLDDSQWGVAISGGNATLFRGANFAGRDTAYDESTTISPAITAGGMSEVVFSKVQATPSTTGSITLSTVSDTRTVSINGKGTVNY